MMIPDRLACVEVVHIVRTKTGSALEGTVKDSLVVVFWRKF